MSIKRSPSITSIEKRFKRNRLTSCSTNELAPLDGLVLRNIISHLPLINGIAQERVNRRFAKMLRKSYSQERVSLKVYFDMPEINLIGRGEVLFAVELTRKRLFGNSSASKLNVESEKLKLVLEQIFKRYKCFLQLTLHPINGDFIVENMADAAPRLPDRSCALSVRRLWFNPGSCDISNASNLIECFSSSLKVLKMYVDDDGEDYMCPSQSEDDSKLLWSTVSKCAHLKKLIWSPINKTEAQNVHLGDCLKKLQIKWFKYNNRNFDADWLHSSIEHNEKLRYLLTGDVQIYSSPRLQPILARLKTLAICHGARYTDSLSLTPIAQSMHQDAFITALEFVCNADDDRSIEGITNALAFWLQLSDETTKLVKLTFGLFNGPLRPNLVDRTLERLLANSTFDGCKLQKATGRRSLLLWRNAQVKFAIVNGHTDPLFDIW